MSCIGTLVHSIIISYDIACQWSVNFFKRMTAPTMPSTLRIPAQTVVKHFVPKFHLAAHEPKCHAPFSFNFAPGVGRTDGEGIEHNWSVLNGIAPCVSMMGPGGRWDTLDDFCNYSNWRKTVNLRMFPLFNVMPRSLTISYSSLNTSSKNDYSHSTSGYPSPRIHRLYRNPPI